MAYTHVQQPERSRVCGQACVAIVAGVSLARALDACTDARRCATSEHDLRRGLTSLGYSLGAFVRLAGGTLPAPAAGALARVRYEWRSHGYHWIVLEGSLVFDPSHPDSVHVSIYERHLRRARGYVTSWAPISRIQ